MYLHHVTWLFYSSWPYNAQIFIMQTCTAFTQYFFMSKKTSWQVIGQHNLSRSSKVLSLEKGNTELTLVQPVQTGHRTLTLWIRWVIAKQPRVIEDVVVIAMGKITECLSQELYPLVRDKWGSDLNVIRTHPPSCLPAAWPGPDD